MDVRYPNAALPSKSAGTFYAAYFGVLGVVMPFLGPFLTGRGIGAVGIGLITAAFSLPKITYAPVLGWLVDRGRWRPGLLSAHVALSLAAALMMVWVRGPLMLGLAVLMLGLGYGAVLPVVETAVLERGRRGYGALRLWGSLGFVLVAGGGGRLLEAIGMEHFPSVVAALLALLILTCRPFEEAGRPPAGHTRDRLPRKVWLLLLLLMMHQVSHGPLYAFFSIHLRTHGMSDEVVGVMWSVGVLVELVAFLLGSRLESALGLRRLLTLALAATPIRWLLLALPPTIAVVAIAQAFHALTFALAHLAAIQLVQRAVPRGAARRAQALYAGLLFGLGIVAGSALSGPIYAAGGGRAAFLAAAGLSIIVLVCWLALSRRLVTSDTDTPRPPSATAGSQKNQKITLPT